MPSEQTKLRKVTALLDEDWLKKGMGGAKTSAEGLRVKWQGSGGNSASSRSAGRIASLGKRFAVVRVGKIKGLGKLSAAANHNSRDRETLNADPDRLDDNQLLWGVEGGQAVLDAWQDRAPDKVRSNAVHALEYVISASPAVFDEMSREEQDDYFIDSLRFLAAKHGPENILSAVVHRDEQTPHLQALVIPLDENERLNARAHVGGRDKLRELQSDFAELVAEPYGIERGQERSVAKHRTIKEYYAAAQKEPDLSAERLHEAIPEREKGSVLKRGESDEAYAARVVDALAVVAADSRASLDKRITDLEAEKKQLGADNDALTHKVAATNWALLSTTSPTAELGQRMWDKAQQVTADSKMSLKDRERLTKTLERIGKQYGFASLENERKVERPKVPERPASKPDKDYER
jgi:hypothetical protein